jgi:hypothetical protein
VREILRETLRKGILTGLKQKRARIEIQPCFNPIFYEKPFI